MKNDYKVHFETYENGTLNYIEETAEAILLKKFYTLKGYFGDLVLHEITPESMKGDKFFKDYSETEFKLILSYSSIDYEREVTLVGHVFREVLE